VDPATKFIENFTLDTTTAAIDTFIIALQSSRRTEVFKNRYKLSN
jgi:hypothetical protein